MFNGKHKGPILAGVSVIALGVVVLVFLSGSDRELDEKDSKASRDFRSVGSNMEPVAAASRLEPRASDQRPSITSDEVRRSVLAQKLDLILAKPDLMGQADSLFDLMHEASMDDLQELLLLSDNEEYPEGLRVEMRSAAFERWYHLDPAAAIRALDAAALSVSRRASRIEVYLEDWAGRAPQEVRAFLEQGDLTGVSGDLVYSALARGSASFGDHALVEEALGRIREPKRRDSALKSVARTLQRDHEGAFAQWWPALEPKDRGVALAEGAWILADRDIDESLARLDQLEDLGAAELPVTRTRVVVKWTRDEPVKAAEWVASQDLQGVEREALFATLLKVWMSEDRNSAVAWVESRLANGEIDQNFMNHVADRMHN